MSGKIEKPEKCVYCGGKYHFTDSYKTMWRSPLCREREAHEWSKTQIRVLTNQVQDLWDHLHAVTDCLGAGLPNLDEDSGKTPSELVLGLKSRMKELTMLSSIVVEYIEDPVRRGFYRKRIRMVAGDKEAQL